MSHQQPLPYEVSYIRKKMAEGHPVTGKFSIDPVLATSEINAQNMQHYNTGVYITKKTLARLFGLGRAVEIVETMKGVAGAGIPNVSPVVAFILELIDPSQQGLDVSHPTAPKQLAALGAPLPPPFARSMLISDKVYTETSDDIYEIVGDGSTGTLSEIDILLRQVPVVSFAESYGWPEIPLGTMQRVFETANSELILRPGGDERRGPRDRDGEPTVIIGEPSVLRLEVHNDRGALEHMYFDEDGTVSQADQVTAALAFVDTLAAKDGYSLVDEARPRKSVPDRPLDTRTATWEQAIDV